MVSLYLCTRTILALLFPRNNFGLFVSTQQFWSCVRTSYDNTTTMLVHMIVMLVRWLILRIFYQKEVNITK